MSEGILEELERVYEEALAFEKAGEPEKAAASYRRVLELDPEDHTGASVRLAAMGEADAPEKAAPAYVATLFDQHAEVFDAMLVDDLGYAIPLELRDELLNNNSPLERVLDLGCGTGLLGEALEGHTDHMTGVDLSEGMLEIAHEKEVYDALFVGDAEAFLEEAEGGPWDAILATDVLPYIGDVETLFPAAATHLKPGGVFGFSAETLPDEIMDGRGYMVGPTHRYAHSENYLREALAQAKLEPVSFEPVVVRYNEGDPVPGFLVIAQGADEGTEDGT